MQPGIVDLWCFILWMLLKTKSKFYTISIQRYRDYKIRVSVPLHLEICVIVVNTLPQNGFPNPDLSRYNLVSLIYQCLNPDTIWTTINVNQDMTPHLSTPLSMGAILHTINVSTRTRSWTINVSTRTRSSQPTLAWTINASARIRSSTCLSKQGTITLTQKKNGVTISTIVFQFYKFIVDRRSYNS